MKHNLESNFHLTESKRFRAKVGVFLMLIQDNKLLCLRRYNTGIEDGLYVVPMGGVRENETPRQAVIREAAEEVNITIEPHDLILAHVMYRKHTQPDGYFFYQQDLYFLTHQYRGTIQNQEPEKADDVQFFPIDDLPPNFSPSVYKAIRCIRNNIIYSEFGFSESECLAMAG